MPSSRTTATAAEAGERLVCPRARPKVDRRNPRHPQPGQRVAVPAGRNPGFANNGTPVLRIQSTLAEPLFEAAYDDKRETPRRWLPGSFSCVRHGGGQPTTDIRPSF